MRRKSKSKKICFDPEPNDEQVKEIAEDKGKKQDLVADTNASEEATHSKCAEKQESNIKEVDDDEEEEVEENGSNSKKDDSKRSKKRKKHMELVVEKKVKSDVSHQERSLNYLSLWKHSPNDWKFEKNRQAWLKQNMFDVDKVPEQFWDILVEYFSNAKGNIRKMMVTDALKIIETHENKDETEGDNPNDVIVSRARAVIQSLQE